jgi:phenylalanyl-tRNA synthetase beta chain
VTIEFKEVRTILSQGMMCAYYELTPHIEYCADEDSKGIILLDDAIVGDRDVAKYIGLDDVMYEIAVPSNRGDLNGVIPICQELAGYFK